MHLFPRPLFNEIVTSKKKEFNILLLVVCFLIIVLFDLIYSAEMEPSALLVRQGLYYCATVLGRRNDPSGASVTLISDHLQLHYEIGTHNRILLFPVFLLLKMVPLFFSQNMF